MNEAEHILKAMWDYVGGVFIETHPDYGYISCYFCAVDMQPGGGFKHAADCPMRRLEAYAEAQGWVNDD